MCGCYSFSINWEYHVLQKVLKCLTAYSTEAFMRNRLAVLYWSNRKQSLGLGTKKIQAFSCLLAIFVPLMLLSVSNYTEWCKQSDSNTVMPPYPLIQYARFTAARKKNLKIKAEKVHKFQNARQVRTGRNMVKFCSPNMTSTWLIFLCPRTHASPQNLPPFCF
jgi:hypothetical protein